jgi:hypothetical protein
VRLKTNKNGSGLKSDVIPGYLINILTIRERLFCGNSDGPAVGIESEGEALPMLLGMVVAHHAS